MNKTIQIPLIDVEGELWMYLGSISKVYTIRATSISKKKRVVDPSGHRMDQIKAEGSVKCKTREWDISEFLSKK
ncbi:MAG: hypothetical protein JSW28_03585 [Thermoplasmata archaeon]|nr:MAG: hypothetical protein JSW28_03585 [Thermoplasmata archaeon]